MKAQPLVDVGIITIRDDEFRAVLKAFPRGPEVYKGRHREYAIRVAEGASSQQYTVAILRQIEQGNGEAQEAARDMIDDLQPSLLLIVGIAGGLPSDDISLGDVVLSTRVLDFSIEARKFEDETTYNVGGGPIAKQIAAGVANLGAREDDLGEWWSDLPPKPSVSSAPSKLYGTKTWQKSVRSSLQMHYGKDVPPRDPLFMAGVIAASDRLVKDPTLLFPWLNTARGILAVEMESAGVHRATRDRVPMLSIRSLSDVVGLKRQDAWTKYACSAAAAFAAAYLRTGPVESKTPKTGGVSADRGQDEGEGPQEGDIEESFANLLQLRHFPETLYVAPALSHTRKAIWAQLAPPTSGKPGDYVSSAWTVHEDMFYSFVDPTRSRLRNVVDVGALEELDTHDWAFSKDENRRRLFVQLLNGALRDDLGAQGVRYFKDQDVYAFLGRPDEPPRRLKHQNLQVRSTVTVVAHYERPGKDGKTFRYQRHSAFQSRFRLLGRIWYLEVTPTYRFTYNGKDLAWYHESLLAGIKRLERNRAVLSQLLVWQATLRAPWKRVSSARHLDFAPLASLTFRTPINERALTALDAPMPSSTQDREVDN